MTSRSLKVLLLALALVASSLAAPRPANATVHVDIGFFFDSLAPHGPWFQHASYGWVWSPNVVAAGWAPYTTGHWVYANQVGWSWASAEPWGWATYHYGRWFFDEYYGWIWVPGYQWAPAWVDYVAYDNYIGWAPLPPAATWSVSVGFAPHYSVPYDRYVFVEPRYFDSPSWHDYAAPRSVSTRYARAGRRITRYQDGGDWVVNRSVDFAPEMALDLVDVSSPRNLRRAVSGGELAVFRPRVAPDASLEPSRQRVARRGSPVARAADPVAVTAVSELARGGRVRPERGSRVEATRERGDGRVARVGRETPRAAARSEERRVAATRSVGSPRVADRTRGNERRVAAAQREQGPRARARGGAQERRIAAAPRVEGPRASAPSRGQERRVNRPRGGEAPQVAERLNGRDRQVAAQTQRLDRARRAAAVREQPRGGRPQVARHQGGGREPLRLAERGSQRRAAVADRGAPVAERQVHGGRPQRQNQLDRAERSGARHERAAGAKPARQKGKGGRG